MSFLISPQANLALQILILMTLIASFILKRLRKYFLHGITMLIAVVLNAVSFLLIMGPSLSNLREFIALYTSDELAVTALIHAALGTVTEVLAIYVLASWRFHSTPLGCARNRKLMRLTFVLWVVALIFGILVYRLLYS